MTPNAAGESPSVSRVRDNFKHGSKWKVEAERPLLYPRDMYRLRNSGWSRERIIHISHNA